MDIKSVGDGLFIVDNVWLISKNIVDACSIPFLFEPAGVESRTYAMFHLSDAETEYAVSLESQEEMLAYVTVTSPAIVLYTVIPDMSIVEIFVGKCMPAYDVNLCIYAITNMWINQYIHVYINPELTEFDEVVEFLVDNNFKNPRLTNDTVSTDTDTRTSIVLQLDKNDPEGPDPSVVSLSLGIRESQVISRDLCSYRVVIPQKVLDKIKTYLHEPTEYGGLLVVQSYSIERDNNDQMEVVAQLGYPLDTETGGNFETVNPPYGFFNFHTHPYHCYRKYGCAVGWPSDSDLSVLPYARDIGDGSNVAHFIITVEGVYSMQVTPVFGKYLTMLRNTDFMNYSDCHALFIQKIKEMFNYLNSMRTSTSDTLIDEFLRYINAVTIKDIIGDRTIEQRAQVCSWIQPDFDFPLYSITYASWDTINSDGMFSAQINSSEHGDCPPSIISELNKIGPKGFV